MAYVFESPIETILSETLVFCGLKVNNQVEIPPYRVDMVVSNRDNRKVIIECDGKEYHHWVVDDFRDDELWMTSRLPICHIKGEHIVQSPENCAVAIINHFFPGNIDTVGYMQCVDIATKKIKEVPIGHQSVLWVYEPSSQEKKRRDKIRQSTNRQSIYELARLYIVEDTEGWEEEREEQLKELDEFIKLRNS
ncbi:MAG: hypothetical protein GY797_20925 [Deltaproteobacteria bacterium]|nr:hypothetical protein [Deltaproteobacteria bacterium]